ncbi:GNAT family N-acetyltransferase [Clostridium vitabionis]|uniref:GNAT family N-acetyltransferase n=1 Tax=Clostridium vitabionis TaxID=2784388 RepID=UPI00188AA123|nr:GNAT family N-acetyltransferase [Clostridium vitabionis]
MLIREVLVPAEGRLLPAVISDDGEALLTAAEAGKTVIGIFREGAGGPGFSRCLYLVDSPEAVTPRLLERAVRRTAVLPWIIAGTPRLIIREFQDSDPLEEPSEHDGDGVFSNWEKRHSYIRNQYRFAEYGIWAVVRKADGRMVGKCGIDRQFGYHIFPGFRRQGYAEEASRAVFSYAKRELGMTELRGWIRADNLASRRLAEKLGMRPCPEPGTALCPRPEMRPGEEPELSPRPGICPPGKPENRTLSGGSGDKKTENANCISYRILL